MKYTIHLLVSSVNIEEATQIAKLNIGREGKLLELSVLDHSHQARPDPYNVQVTTLTELVANFKSVQAAKVFGERVLSAINIITRTERRVSLSFTAIPDHPHFSVGNDDVMGRTCCRGCGTVAKLNARGFHRDCAYDEVGRQVKLLIPQTSKEGRS